MLLVVNLVFFFQFILFISYKEISRRNSVQLNNTPPLNQNIILQKIYNIKFILFYFLKSQNPLGGCVPPHRGGHNPQGTMYSSPKDCWHISPLTTVRSPQGTTQGWGVRWYRPLPPTKI